MSRKPPSAAPDVVPTRRGALPTAAPRRAGRAGSGGSAAEGAARYQAPALEKGLDIVELLAGEPEALTQNQIAQRLGRSASEIFRMLEVLERRGWIARSAEGAYATTLTLFELAHRQAPVNRLLSAALPEMRLLARRTGQSNHLVVYRERRILVLAQVDSPGSMGFSVRQGAHFPFRTDRTSARVLTAFQQPARRAELTAELLDGDPAPPSRESLERNLDTIRRRGWEQRRSDTLPGITDICFPILDRHGDAIATLLQSYLAHRDLTVTVADARQMQAGSVATICARLGAPGAQPPPA
jgi:DNA-binding IclR family transcriptional regulator